MRRFTFHYKYGPRSMETPSRNKGGISSKYAESIGFGLNYIFFRIYSGRTSVTRIGVGGVGFRRTSSKN